MKRVSLLAVLLLVAASPVASQVPNDKLIVPGQRIGTWTLQMTVQELLGMLGPPPRSVRGPRQGGQPSADLQGRLRPYIWDRAGLIAYTEDDRSILLLEVDSTPEFMTEKGVKWGVPRADVERAHGQPTRVTQWGPNPTLVTLQYNEIGLEVGFASTGRVEFIGVFRPGTASSIWKP